MSSFCAMAQNAGIPSQSFSAPFVMSPALTGLAKGFRLTGNDINYQQDGYDQRMQNYSADMPILRNKLPAGDAIGAGLFYQRVRFDAGTVWGYWSTLRAIGASAAYHKHIGKKEDRHLSIGLQAAFSDRHDEIIYPLPIDVRARSMIYSAGIAYTHRVSERASFGSGLAFQNLTTPTIDLGGSTSVSTKVRLMSFAAGSYRITKGCTLYGSAIYTKSFPQGLFKGGAYAGAVVYHMRRSHDAMTLYFGGYYGSDKVATPYLGLGSSYLRFGLSSDLYSDRRGHPHSFEISVVETFRFAKTTSAKKWEAPTLF